MPSVEKRGSDKREAGCPSRGIQLLRKSVCYIQDDSFTRQVIVVLLLSATLDTGAALLCHTCGAGHRCGKTDPCSAFPGPYPPCSCQISGRGMAR